MKMDSILFKLSRPDLSNGQFLATADHVHGIFGVSNVLANNGKIVLPYRLSAISISRYSFQALIARLVDQLHSKSKSSKTLRNEIAFLVCLFSAHFRKAKKYLLDCGPMVLCVTSQAIRGMEKVDTYFHSDSSPEDVEFLQYFIYLFKCIVETGKAEKIINDSNIISSLLTLTLGPSRFSKKVTDLEKAAWGSLHAIAKYQPKALIHEECVTPILDFLKSYGAKGQFDDPYTLSMAMHLIRILLSSHNPPSGCGKKTPNKVEGYFIEREGMAAFLGVIRYLIMQETLGTVGKLTICNALFSCAVLGMSEPRQKRVFCGLNGISTLMSVMTTGRLLNPHTEKTSVDTMMETAVSECICSCVAYDPECLEEFLSNVGMFKLLDLIQLCEDPITSAHLIGCLLQLCDYPRCMDQLLCWSRSLSCTDRVVFGDILDTGIGHVPRSGIRVQELESTSNRSLGSLFCALWKWEERRLKSLRDPDGCIASLTNPLMPLSVIIDGNTPTGVIRSLLALYRRDCIRPKIFVLVSSIVEETKTKAFVFEGLSLINQVIMTSILNYNDLKVSEIRIEIIDKMHQEGYTNSCEEDLSKMLTICMNRVGTVMQLQRYLVRKHKEKEASSEYDFYYMIKHCHLQDHLMAAKEIEYIARTSDYSFLVESRLWQKLELKNALKDLLNVGFIKDSKIHRTSNGRLNITTWTSRTKNVLSEPPITYSLDDIESERKLAESRETEEEAAFRISEAALAALASVTNSEVNSPAPLEGGFYELPPYFLKEELEKVQARDRGHSWVKNAINEDTEHGWQVRLKWKKDWYPLELA